MPKSKKPIILDQIKESEKLKYEIAGELGLLDRVLTDGWGALSARETGRIGGILRHRNRLAAASDPDTTPRNQNADD